MANRLSQQDIDELAQSVQDRFGGDIADFRARAYNLHIFLQMLLYIADYPNTVDTFIDNLAAQTPSADGTVREDLAAHALWMLLFARIRRGSFARHEPTTRDGGFQPIGYGVRSLHPPRTHVNENQRQRRFQDGHATRNRTE
jgi:hypothetical protein